MNDRAPALMDAIEAPEHAPKTHAAPQPRIAAAVANWGDFEANREFSSGKAVAAVEKAESVKRGSAELLKKTGINPG